MAPPMPKVEVSKKNIPQSGQPLKSFNWAKLPELKIQNTVWSELDETKWYNSMDLESIDKLFSAYQNQKNERNGVSESESAMTAVMQDTPTTIINYCRSRLMDQASRTCG
jgi:hypothetical protein